MLQPGKLPPAMLADLLARVTRGDRRVVAGPRIGRDAAVIDLGGRLLVASTDPVTFAAEDIGWYAVNVNANDIACMGARPAWFLATVLLPAGAPATLPSLIFDQLHGACAALGVELVGGHTEVTLGIERPIVVGAMLGEASSDEIVLGENIAAGDRVLLTKGIAIEGTALLAREAGPALTAAGVAPAIIGRARGMLLDPGISVVADAKAVALATKPRLMHDPTEGGLATALDELAQGCGMTISVDLDRVPVFAETRTICSALGLDPLGLLASGALLAVVPGDAADRVARDVSDRGVLCTPIGAVAVGPPRVILAAGDSVTPLPAFARDELARFFDDAARTPNE